MENIVLLPYCRRGRQFIQKDQWMLVACGHIGLFGQHIVDPSNVLAFRSIQLFDFFNAFEVRFLAEFSCDLRWYGMGTGSDQVRLVVTKFDVIEALVTRDVEGSHVPALRLGACT